MAITDPEYMRRKFEQELREQMLGGVTSSSAFLGGSIAKNYEFQTTPQTMLYHASVEKAENGYILKVTHKQGEQPKVFVAADTEELQRVFIAAIVAERVGK